jgi:hypothetical protein
VRQTIKRDETYEQLVGVVLSARRLKVLHYVNQYDKLSVEEHVEWLSKAICRHLSHSDVAVLTLLLSVFVVDVNVFCMLVESVFADHVQCRVIVRLEIEWLEIVTSISEL